MSESGAETRTLWGELAAQLGRYDVVAEHDRLGAAPGGDALRQVLGDGPVLLLLDEVLAYVEKALAVERGESNAGRQAMLFIQALTEAVNSHPSAVMVYSLQASVGEAVGAEGCSRSWTIWYPGSTPSASRCPGTMSCASSSGGYSPTSATPMSIARSRGPTQICSDASLRPSRKLMMRGARQLRRRSSWSGAFSRPTRSTLSSWT